MWSSILPLWPSTSLMCAGLLMKQHETLLTASSGLKLKSCSFFQYYRWQEHYHMTFSLFFSRSTLSEIPVFWSNQRGIYIYIFFNVSILRESRGINMLLLTWQVFHHIYNLKITIGRRGLDCISVFRNLRQVTGTRTLQSPSACSWLAASLR